MTEARELPPRNIPAPHRSGEAGICVDANLIVSGEVCLELDGVAEVRLEAGDCVVQNGTRHRWRNPSSEPCVMAVAQIGGTRRP